MARAKKYRDRPEFQFEIKTLNESQDRAIETIRSNTVSLLLGPPGTAKSHCAMMYAVHAIGTGKYEKIYLCRPAIEAGGERLGYVPGDLQAKLLPYVQPLYNILGDNVDEAVRDQLAGIIEVIPMAYLRGRTLRNGIAILDEIQNCNHALLKLFLTRIGHGTKMILCGDIGQTDIRDSVLKRAAERLSKIDGIGIHWFTSADNVRHPLAGLMGDAMDEIKQ